MFFFGSQGHALSDETRAWEPVLSMPLERGTLQFAPKPQTKTCLAFGENDTLMNPDGLKKVNSSLVATKMAKHL